MAGNSANKSKLYFLPHGVVPQTLRDNPLKDGFDDWLARIVCFAFSVSPQALQPAMNKASAEQASGEAMKEGLEPLQIWVRDFVNECILRGFGYDDIEFVWTEETAINPAAQAEINTTYLKAGIKTVNEVRGEIGLPHVAEGDRLLVYTSTGVVGLGEMSDSSGAGVTKSFNPDQPRDDHGRWNGDGTTAEDVAGLEGRQLSEIATTNIGQPGDALYAALQGVNPGNGTDNCGPIVFAVVKRLTGLDPNATADPARIDTNDDQIESALNTKFDFSYQSIDAIYEKLDKEGDGAIAILSFSYPRDREGHVVVIANDRGVVGLIEGQKDQDGKSARVITNRSEATNRYNPNGSAVIGVGILASRIAR